jgi:hypothetical protein
MSAENCESLKENKELYEDITYYEDRTPLLGRCRTAQEIAGNSSLPKFTLPILKVSIPGLTEFEQPDFCKGEEGSTLCINWIGQYISSLARYLVGIVGIVSAIALMVGGIMWLMAGGNQSAIKRAKTLIINSLVGLTLILCSYIILSLISPRLTTFSSLRIPWIQGLGLPKFNKSGGSCANGDCTQVDEAIANNAYNVPGDLLKALFVGGEGCNPNSSPAGACGYSQLMPPNRSWCGIAGNQAETCQKVKDDIQLAVNCAAKLLAEDMLTRCGSDLPDDIRDIASCYNSGRPNNCDRTDGGDYCDRVENYYNNNCSKSVPTNPGSTTSTP